MDTYIITKLVTEALTAALIYGTLLFFTVKGFINPLFWQTTAKGLRQVRTGTATRSPYIHWICSLTLFFRLFQAFCFLGGILGAVKILLAEEKKKLPFLNHAFSQKRWLKQGKARSSHLSCEWWFCSAAL